MPMIKMPTGENVFVPGTQEDADKHKEVLDARWKFSTEYCRSKGWPEDPTKLSIPQIMEIREQEGWKNPVPNTPHISVVVMPEKL